MKAIVVLFDSMVRKYLHPYGANDVYAPAFGRLAEHAVTFDSSFACSLPCIPARRDLHTGRSNFLHREWGPLEPFDDSVFDILNNNGVYTHLITDHLNYWGEGGGNYHTKYRSCEFVRGQEGDPWKARVDGPKIPEVFKTIRSHSGDKPANAWTTNWVNREYQDRADEETFPQHKVFGLAEEFLRQNSEADNWMLQIESFSPHEPFASPDVYRELYPDKYRGPLYDWPRGPVGDDETEEVLAHMRNNYKSMITMTDHNLSRILDLMDEKDMWKDTLLIVGADHGFLLGEHGYWAKNTMPLYNEIANTPLFIYDPRSGVKGERRRSIVQMIDWAPTLLDFFGLAKPMGMLGEALAGVIQDDTPVRASGIFGIFGGHVNIVTDDYIYMRAASPEYKDEIYNYTISPYHIFKPFTAKELVNAEAGTYFEEFSKKYPLFKVKAGEKYNLSSFGSLLFDRKNDPEQMEPLSDANAENRMCDELVKIFAEHDVPKEQYIRYGLELPDK